MNDLYVRYLNITTATQHLMNAHERDQLEEQIQALTVAGDLTEAVSKTVEGYGPEILAYLLANMGNEDHATQVYSDFCMSVFENLGNFQWRSSLRTWVYRIATHGRADFYRGNHRRKEDKQVALSRAPQVFALADEVRTRTLKHVRTSIKDRFSELRAQLKPEEQELLVLHVNRKLTFKEIAVILWEDDSEPDEAQLKRSETRQRTRFHRLKSKLKTLARKEGLMDL